MRGQEIVLKRDETAPQSDNAIMDPLDKFAFGPLNLLDKLFGAIKKAARPSRRGRFGRTFRVVIPQMDKGGLVSFYQCKNHLESHGVRTFNYAHDDRNMYLYVRESQRSQAEALLKGGELTPFGSKWKDRPRGRATGRQRPERETRRPRRQHVRNKRR